MFKPIVVGFFIIGLFLAGCNPTGGKTSVLNVSEVDSKKAVTDYISYSGEDGKTALELLKNMATVESEVVEGGTVVNAINGQAFDYINNKNWLLYVNGQLQEVLPDKYMTKTGDLIEWKYGSLQEKL